MCYVLHARVIPASRHYSNFYSFVYTELSNVSTRTHFYAEKYGNTQLNKTLP